MKKSTNELLKILSRTSNLNTYLSDEKESLCCVPLHDYLNQLCAKKNMSPAQCIKASGLDRTYAYQIFSGTKIPARDKVIALGFGFQLSLDEVQTMLKSTGYPFLYPKNERDSAIIFALQRNCSIIDLNELLSCMGFDIIK